MKKMDDQMIVLILLCVSVAVAMGGPMIAMLLTVGHWDRDIWNIGMLCFPIGMLAMMMTAGLNAMVDARESAAHQEKMDEIRKSLMR